MEKATFGAGCFWHVEEEFSKLEGVKSTEVGFMGGKLANPSYKDVCSDKTGHAEVVHIVFDPKKIPYSKLLETFWRIHDPSQLNRQGPDVGTQYRSVIFYHTRKQKQDTLKSKKQQQKNFGKKIVTEIKPPSEFWKAEEYHQKYFRKHKSLACRSGI